jgi:hypothetical protein
MMEVPDEKGTKKFYFQGQIRSTRHGALFTKSPRSFFGGRTFNLCLPDDYP